jgi:predicted RNA-binding Zn ribbon-like protein
MTDRAERHTHQATLEDTLDFINTLEFERDGPTDAIGTAPVAIEWFASRGLAHADANLAGDPRTIERIRAVRGALRAITEAIAADRPAPRSALVEANRALRARAILELIPADSGVAPSHRHIGDPVNDALARLVEPLVIEMAAGRPDRIRICDNDTCRWVFYDSSRTGRRRWCDMAICGNRAKAARFRARRRASPGAGSS